MRICISFSSWMLNVNIKQQKCLTAFLVQKYQIRHERYVIENLHDHIIDATIACAGKRIFISRIPIIPSDNIFPFHMKRKQFPVRPAFAITANKAQGETLSHVGIYLKQDFFLHGQLYVAMSRVGSKDSLKIYSGHGVYTSNVVYKEVLNQ